MLLLHFCLNSHKVLVRRMKSLLLDYKIKIEVVVVGTKTQTIQNLNNYIIVKSAKLVVLALR